MTVLFSHRKINNHCFMACKDFLLKATNSYGTHTFYKAIGANHYLSCSQYPFFFPSNKLPEFPGYVANRNKRSIFRLPCSQLWPDVVEVSHGNF